MAGSESKIKTVVIKQAVNAYVVAIMVDGKVIDTQVVTDYAKLVELLNITLDN